MTYTKLDLNTSLRHFAAVMNSATDRAWHYVKPDNEKFPYLIWTEIEEGDSFDANNRKKHQPINIDVEYYTQREFDPVIDNIQEAMNAAEGIAFRLTDVQFEESTNVIHYSWEATVYGKNCIDGD